MSYDSFLPNNTEVDSNSTPLENLELADHSAEIIVRSTNNTWPIIREDRSCPQFAKFVTKFSAQLSRNTGHYVITYYILEVSIGIQNFGIPIPTDNRHRNSVGHQQIYRTYFGTTPKDSTYRAINWHYCFRVVLKTLSCSVYLVLKC